MIISAASNTNDLVQLSEKDPMVALLIVIVAIGFGLLLLRIGK